MPQKSTINSLRSELNSLNQNILTSLKSRSDILESIMSIKNQDGLYAWDPEREKVVFSQLFSAPYDLIPVSLYLTISFMIESQAKDFHDDYPQWSLGEHLVGKDQSMWARLNPVLLKLINNSEYEKLALKEKFKARIKE